MKKILPLLLLTLLSCKTETHAPQADTTPLHGSWVRGSYIEFTIYTGARKDSVYVQGNLAAQYDFSADSVAVHYADTVRRDLYQFAERDGELLLTVPDGWNEKSRTQFSLEMEADTMRWTVRFPHKKTWTFDGYNHRTDSSYVKMAWVRQR